MKMQCPNCGQWLEIPGRAATCPNCGSLVTIPVSPLPPAPGMKAEPDDTTYEQPARYAPPKIVTEMPDWVRATIIIGLIGLFAFGTIFFAIWRISVRFAGPTVAPVANPATPP